MNIFFDMDNTLIGDRHQLRPLVHETLSQITRDGHTIYVWSGMGIRWAEVHMHELGEFVRDCFHKPLDEEGQRTLTHIPPDLVVDDIPAFVDIFGGVVVKPYYMTNPRDRELDRVYRIIKEVEQTGTSQDPAFRLGTLTQRFDLNGNGRR